MKKTLAAVAVLGAFAASASADVTVYGKIDLGIGYTNSGDTDKIEMVNGGSSTSRIGFKGTEKIGDLTVGFQYEGKVAGDEGTGSFTDRITRVYVKGAYGELSAGRYGVLDSGTGPHDLAASLTYAGTGYYGDIMAQDWVMQTNSRMGNALTYTTPSFGGLTLVAQIASKAELDETDWVFDTKSGARPGVDGDRPGAEYSHDADMYYALGAQYKAGAFMATVIASQMDWANTVGEDTDDATNVTAGVSYDFGVAKAYLAANYYENGTDGHDQYGVVASVSAPVAGGTLAAAAGFGKVSTDDGDTDKVNVGVFYKYPLSNQTYLYGAAGWKQADATDVVKDGKAGKDVKTTEAVFGICHNF